jgi:molecular chaperone Hsp33
MATTDYANLPAQDFVLHFMVDDANSRGRLIRLGATLDDIISRHDYPAAVNNLVAQAATLTAALASALKFDGIFTLQTKGNGPISRVVADMTSAGELRACASFDTERLAALPADAPFTDLVGEGYLAFTIDQGTESDRYQGIVALQGEGFDSSVTHYFRQSEQVATGIKLSCGQNADGHWRGGAMLVQRLPDESAAGKPHSSDVEDGWRHSMVLLATCTETELQGPEPAPLQLVYNVFHEQDPQAAGWSPVHRGCRCSRPRIENVLSSIPRSELLDLRVDGVVSVNCEFCNETYLFNDADIDTISPLH